MSIISYFRRIFETDLSSKTEPATSTKMHHIYMSTISSEAAVLQGLWEQIFELVQATSRGSKILKVITPSVSNQSYKTTEVIQMFTTISSPFDMVVVLYNETSSPEFLEFQKDDMPRVMINIYTKEFFDGSDLAKAIEDIVAL